VPNLPLFLSDRRLKVDFTCSFDLQRKEQHKWGWGYRALQRRREGLKRKKFGIT